MAAPTNSPSIGATTGAHHNPRTVSEAIVSEASHGGEKARAKIARGNQLGTQGGLVHAALPLLLAAFRAASSLARISVRFRFRQAASLQARRMIPGKVTKNGNGTPFFLDREGAACKIENIYSCY